MLAGLGAGGSETSWGTRYGKNLVGLLSSRSSCSWLATVDAGVDRRSCSDFGFLRCCARLLALHFAENLHRLSVMNTEESFS